jgi:hypothetical protein
MRVESRLENAITYEVKDSQCFDIEGSSPAGQRGPFSGDGPIEN